jgi:hypothetical protein
MAWTNGYGRDLEDQADRVGLRYVYEGGFDAARGPQLWKRFAKKYGDGNKVANFFFANHSRSSARAANLEREVALNYPVGAADVRFARTAPPRPLAVPEPVAAPAKEAAALVAPGHPASRFTYVENGMSAEEVRALLGPPDKEIVLDTRTRWTYPDGTVLFENGLVIEVRF